MKAICGNCRFWSKTKDVAITGGRVVAGLGECRRHAPGLPQPDTILARQWPGTNNMHWCGDHEREPGEMMTPQGMIGTDPQPVAGREP